MSADFKRIRKEMDKLKPSFPAALDRAFDLMKEHELASGGDEHHGLLRSMWPEFCFLKQNMQWNLVRIPHQTHVRVHTLYAAAFDGTPFYSSLMRAHILFTSRRGSKFDSPKWQSSIRKYTVNGVLYVNECSEKNKTHRGPLRAWAIKRGIRVASVGEARQRSVSKYDSPFWKKIIKVCTKDGLLYRTKCVLLAKGKGSVGGLGYFAKLKGIKVANRSQAKKGSNGRVNIWDSPAFQKLIKKFTVEGILLAGPCADAAEYSRSSLHSYAKRHNLRKATAWGSRKYINEQLRRNKC
jgi:hypothetical protein